MKIRAAMMVAVSVAAVSIPVTVAGTATADQPQCKNNNWMCAWEDADYTGDRLFAKNPSVGAEDVGVQERDEISSGRNFTAKKFCGVSENTAWPDETVFVWGQGDDKRNLSEVDNANDTIDHFDVVAAGGTCPNPT